MTTALAYKELRESLGIGVVGLAVLVTVALGNIGYSPFPSLFNRYQQGQIPFVSDSFGFQFALAAGVLAIALGLRQSLGDFWGDAQLFVLHRPISRGRIYAVKLLVGLALYLILAALPIVLYAVWAATPGTHASPFAWSMTMTAWSLWLAGALVYLGAFLSGIRPAAWFGTRLAPLAAAVSLAMLGFALPAPIFWTGSILCSVLFFALILQVAATRDFA